MSDAAPVVQKFQKRIREELPELAASVTTPAEDASGNLTLLDVPCPSNPSRCRLGVSYRGDCIEIAFSVAEARGPAEQQITLPSDPAGAVEAAVDFLRGIVTNRVLVDVLRYRFLWFQPYRLAFFREASRRPARRPVETLRWTVTVTAIVVMLRDDLVLEIFDSPESPPDWIEAIDIENGEYRFCDSRGQRYVGVITRPSGWFREAEFQLRPQGSPDIKNALALVDVAKAIEPNDRFPTLEALRQHLAGVGPHYLHIC